MKKGLKQMTLDAMQAEQNKVVKSKPRSMWADYPKPKPAPVKKQKPVKLVPVAVEDMKIGMTISGHGKVTKATPFTGRKPKKGKALKGFLFITTEHPNGYFMMDGSTVWIVK